MQARTHNPSDCARQHRRASAASKSGRVIPESDTHRALGPGFRWPLGASLERLHWHSCSVRFEQLVQSPFQKLRAHGRVPASSAVSERNRLCGISRVARQAVPCLPDEGGQQSAIRGISCVARQAVPCLPDVGGHQSAIRMLIRLSQSEALVRRARREARHAVPCLPRLLDLEARKSTISGTWYSRPHGRPSARAMPLVPSELHAETIEDANH